eukprot:6178720-Pleurochrysis_carterae.AAC.5
MSEANKHVLFLLGRPRPRTPSAPALPRACPCAIAALAPAELYHSNSQCIDYAGPGVRRHRKGYAASRTQGEDFKSRVDLQVDMAHGSSRLLLSTNCHKIKLC